MRWQALFRLSRSIIEDSSAYTFTGMLMVWLVLAVKKPDDHSSTALLKRQITRIEQSDDSFTPVELEITNIELSFLLWPNVPRVFYPSNYFYNYSGSRSSTSSCSSPSDRSSCRSQLILQSSCLDVPSASLSATSSLCAKLVAHCTSMLPQVALPAL